MKEFFNRWKNLCIARGVDIKYDEDKNVVFVDGAKMSTSKEIGDYLNPKPILPQFAKNLGR